MLRVLQEGEFEPVGSTQTRKVDVRVLAATHKDLRQGAAEGWFREDLYYRLEVVPVDRAAAARTGGRRRAAAATTSCSTSPTSTGSPRRRDACAAAAKLLQAHAWPGNVRELMNVAERLVILRHGLEVDGATTCPTEMRDPAARPAAATPGRSREASAYADLPPC